ncbi:hypothetical protein [Dactylosporangium sp. CS-033363]|uniref:hypothetical protein n=1 Tax=Dactylosporangium sp. CS-033363 TaxID=3239935 RepID=UPI003D8CF181
MTTLTPAELTPAIEGQYFSPKMQWWCAHADLVDSDGTDWSFYFWPALGSLDEAWIATLYTGDEVVDLTEIHLPLGSLKAAREGVDVTFGSQYIRGTYPDYEISVEGEHNGEPVSLRLSMKANMPAFTAIPNLRGITWHYVPQFEVTGAVSRAGTTKDVTGRGYLERRRGRFWAPGVARGIWESIPAASSGGLSVPLFYKVWRDDGSIQLQTLTFTVDGKELVDFGDVEVDILETAKLPGFEDIDHPMRFRLRAEGDGGQAELEVVRSPHRLMMRNYFIDPDPDAAFAGFYGPGQTTGTITYRGETHVVQSRSFGSALFFSRRSR